MDRSKFARCLTPLVVEVPASDREKVFGTKKRLADFVDEKVTLAASELLPANGNVRVRGSLYLGHLTPDQLTKLTETTESHA